MYFFAFPLLSLVASTICASPVRIQSRGNSMSALQLMSTYEIKTLPNKKVYRNFHENAKRIEEWSDPDDVVEPLDQDPAHRIIIKRVDLSTVIPEHGLTGGESERKKAQEKQIFIEIKNLEGTDRLSSWYVMVEKSKEGEDKTIAYIGIKNPGVPSTECNLTTVQRKEARKCGVWYDQVYHNLALDLAHSEEDKNFSFVYSDDKRDSPTAVPIMLRYAKPPVMFF